MCANCPWNNNSHNTHDLKCVGTLSSLLEGPGSNRALCVIYKGWAADSIMKKISSLLRKTEITHLVGGFTENGKRTKRRLRFFLNRPRILQKRTLYSWKSNVPFASRTVMFDFPRCRVRFAVYGVWCGINHASVVRLFVRFFQTKKRTKRTVLDQHMVGIFKKSAV